MVLRTWASRSHFGDYVREPVGYSWPESEGPTHVLTYMIRLADGTPSREVRISFTELVGFPELVRVRSTNWRCEHEPSGFMPKAKARRLYRECLDAGMEPEVRP